MTALEKASEEFNLKFGKFAKLRHIDFDEVSFKYREQKFRFRTSYYTGRKTKPFKDFREWIDDQNFCAIGAWTKEFFQSNQVESNDVIDDNDIKSFDMQSDWFFAYSLMIWAIYAAFMI